MRVLSPEPRRSMTSSVSFDLCRLARRTIEARMRRSNVAGGVRNRSQCRHLRGVLSVHSPRTTPHRSRMCLRRAPSSGTSRQRRLLQPTPELLRSHSRLSWRSGLDPSLVHLPRTIRVLLRGRHVAGRVRARSRRRRHGVPLRVHLRELHWGLHRLGSGAIDAWNPDGDVACKLQPRNRHGLMPGDVFDRD